MDESVVNTLPALKLNQMTTSCIHTDLIIEYFMHHIKKSLSSEKRAFVGGVDTCIFQGLKGSRHMTRSGGWKVELEYQRRKKKSS